MSEHIKNFNQFLNEETTNIYKTWYELKDGDSITFNTRKEYEDLHFKCVNFRRGSNRVSVDCELYCVENGKHVAHGTVQWILKRFGKEMGMNIINLDEAEIELDKRKLDNLY
jgi:hypothetical protein